MLSRSNCDNQVHLHKARDNLTVPITNLVPGSHMLHKNETSEITEKRLSLIRVADLETLTFHLSHSGGSRSADKDSSQSV